MSGDVETFTMQAALYTMKMTQETFLEHGSHPVVIVAIKDATQVETISDADVIEIKKQIPVDVDHKDIMSTMVRATVQAIDAQFVIHIAETWMATHAEAALDNPLIKKLFNGDIAVSDLPDDMKKESLMVKVDRKDGFGLILESRIIRDGDKVTLGDVQYMTANSKDEDLKTSGRFSGWWRNDPVGDLQAIGISMSASASRAWEYTDEEEDQDADGSS
jgi:hypothetical protein